MSASASEDASLYTKQFVYSKGAQYRKLKSEWKSNVYLGRSNIQVLTPIVPVVMVPVAAVDDCVVLVLLLSYLVVVL